MDTESGAGKLETANKFEYENLDKSYPKKRNFIVALVLGLLVLGALIAVIYAVVYREESNNSSPPSIKSRYMAFVAGSTNIDIYSYNMTDGSLTLRNVTNQSSTFWVSLFPKINPTLLLATGSSGTQGIIFIL